MTFFDLDPEVQRIVEPELYDGETLLWADKSKSKGLFSRASVTDRATLGMIMGLGVFFLFGVMMFIMRQGLAMPMIRGPIPMIIILLGVGAVVFALRRGRQSASSVYALTDQRALIITAGLMGGKTIKSYGEADISHIERHEHRDGTGDVLFAHEPRAASYYAGSGVYGKRHTIDAVGFFGIRHARDVEMLMLETFKLRDAGQSKYKHDDFAEDGERADDDDLTFLADDNDQQARL
jgi:hypothetical protein